jgi:hypothetical protein
LPLGDEDLMVLRDARRASRVAVRRSFGSETTESELCDFTEEPEDFRDFFMGVWGDKEGYYKYAHRKPTNGLKTFFLRTFIINGPVEAAG